MATDRKKRRIHISKLKAEKSKKATAPKKAEAVAESEANEDNPSKH